MIRIVYCTFPSKASAQKMIDALLDKKLIACGALSPITSSFVWNGKRENSKEWFTMLKTSKAKTVEKFICARHPYDVPCVLSWNVRANRAFEAWVRKQ